MPIPAIIPLASLVFGAFNFGNSVYNIFTAKPDAIPDLRARIDALRSDMVGLGNRVGELHIAQTLNPYVDRILAFYQSYQDRVIPMISDANLGLMNADDPKALDKLTELFVAHNILKDWARDVHNAGEGASACLRAIYNHMSGTQVDRSVLDDVLRRALVTVYNYDNLEDVMKKLPFAAVRAGASKVTGHVDDFMVYLLNIQRIALGCLLNADLLDPDYRREIIIKKGKQDLLANAEAQIQDVIKRISIFSSIGQAPMKILIEIRKDCLMR